MKRFRWDKKYLYWGITGFLVVVASILFYIFLTRITGIKAFFSYLMTILSPFIWGLVIAYLLCPLMNVLQRSVFTPLGSVVFRGRDNAEQRTFKLARGLSVFLCIIFLFVIITALILLIVPRIVQSLQSIVVNSTEFAKDAYAWFDRILADYPEIEETVSAVFGNVSNGVLNWLKDSILPQVNSLLSNVTSGVVSAIKGIYNIIIGIIVSVYVMYNKEIFGSHVRKLIYCIFSVEASEKIIKAIDFVDHVFIGFISGKILDSTIIGVICYVVCLLLKMPYALLVAFIIGVTNIIPFFGPFIGAVPTAIIILMESPVQCLIFIIFIFVLQQFDGNILGPKILGNSVGINGFWIMFSIIVGAGLFGFAGMLLGVPVFVVLYTGLTTLVNRKLKRSGLPTDGEYYKNLDYIDPETGEGVRKEENRRRKSPKSHPWMKKTGSGSSASGEKKGKDSSEKTEKETDGGSDVSDEGKS